MQIKFDKEEIANGILDIDDLSDLAIKATNDSLEDYYLLIKTRLGKSHIIQYGPIQEDFEILPETVICSYESKDFNEKSIEKLISFFLNDRKKKIRYAEVLDINTAASACSNLVDYVIKL